MKIKDLDYFFLVDLCPGRELNSHIYSFNITL